MYIIFISFPVLFQVRVGGRGGVRHCHGKRLQDGEERLMPHRREGSMESDHQSNICIFLFMVNSEPMVYQG